VTDADAAHAEAERLVREAEALARAAAERVPPRGWDAPRPAAEGTNAFESDLAALRGLVELLRGSIPPDLARQLLEALRDVLLAVVAVIEWALRRVEDRHVD
jgi:hypothetical protein